MGDVWTDADGSVLTSADGLSVLDCDDCPCEEACTCPTQAQCADCPATKRMVLANAPGPTCPDLTNEYELVRDYNDLDGCFYQFHRVYAIDEDNFWDLYITLRCDPSPVGRCWVATVVVGSTSQYFYGGTSCTWISEGRASAGGNCPPDGAYAFPTPLMEVYPGCDCTTLYGAVA